MGPAVRVPVGQASRDIRGQSRSSAAHNSLDQHSPSDHLKQTRDYESTKKVEVEKDRKKRTNFISIVQVRKYHIYYG